MNIVKRLRVFLLLNMETKLLFLEAFIFLGWARVLKSITFSKVAPSLGDYMNETSVAQIQQHEDTLKEVSEAISIMSRYTFWESQCLVKAIAGMKMLQKRDIESTLYLGTAKDNSGELIAHAWLRSGSFYVTGSEGMEKFTVVGSFAKRLSENTIKGE
ncbi:TPA: lasso peptide biosynthesis B2 protein [Bacillus toyonensis]|uniref:lasso peptide biosynthesis B2 protein n=1 Tax=Bacillus cereus group TaxID=86661 RepID=UPI0002F668F0|nr:lasso peptide biosynthesis B2 protein [Bacillus toyonensis]OTW94463.1 stage V sporulation protein S [Bacillus thuringiensis serovar cameroun]OTX02291.1 stage V sporulation protein S [Bacillus thuringiensis serovar seoulensis]QPW47467.1 lasso peptide biosynthesis B2 protein [Bacillus thuringiensis]MCA1047674.1 lasso peptide biosynthesis B2 protein [Bacillus toyonensis]MDO8155830.1 lasso peptide biosynthesis B2 protein [Bacillus toyonensis]